METEEVGEPVVPIVPSVGSLQSSVSHCDPKMKGHTRTSELPASHEKDRLVIDCNGGVVAAQVHSSSEGSWISMLVRQAPPRRLSNR